MPIVERLPRGLALVPPWERRTVRMTPMAWRRRRRFVWQRIEIMRIERIDRAEISPGVIVRWAAATLSLPSLSDSPRRGRTWAVPPPCTVPGCKPTTPICTHRLDSLNAPGPPTEGTD